MPKKAQDVTISLALASKLASVVVHADELNGPLGHTFDLEALKSAARDPEVQEWIAELGPLAPLKRKP